MNTKKTLLLLFSIIIVTCSAFSQNKKVKNVIFLIGDGMGLNQMYAAMTHNGNHLNVERCTYIGLSKTYSANDYITDSGAGGTALACGVKTNNGMIGQTPDSTNVESILQIAKDNGLSTGLVVTSSVTHATPASFVAHEPNRNMDKEIAADYLKTDIDVFIGGGRKFFENSIDNRNLIDELKNKDYQVCSNLEEVSSVKSGKLAGLLYEEHPGIANTRNDLLAKGTEKAIELLSQNKDGFFLMIEGSQIDWSGHNNDANYLIEEMMDFDKTIGIVLDFAEKNGETLVIITADHETGGMIIAKGNFQQGTVDLKYTTDYHTGVIVPVYAFGKGAENFTGMYENTSFKNKLIKILKLKDKSELERIIKK